MVSPARRARIMSQEKTPTLIDLALRETFRKRRSMTTVHPSLQGLLVKAKRFVFDETASAFLADLTFANFHRKTIKHCSRVFESTRVLARLPHKITWIEYDVTAAAR